MINQAFRTRTIETLKRDRIAYLCAVASHHSRVAQIACDMAKLARYESFGAATLETLESMAAKIEESHIEAFGVPMLDEPSISHAKAAR